MMGNNALRHWGLSVPYCMINKLQTSLWPPQALDMNLIEITQNDMKWELGTEKHRLPMLEEITVYAKKIWG